MNKENIISEIKKYYPEYDKVSSLSLLDYYNTPEIKELKVLMNKKYNHNEYFLNVPKWFVLKKWPKPIFTRQANIPDVMWPYFSIWIHDFVNGDHYTITASHIIPFFLIFRWKNKNISPQGFDYFAEAVDRKQYFSNLTFEEYNPTHVVGITVEEIEEIYQKYLGSKLFKNIKILDEIVSGIYFENNTENKFLIRSLFDGASKHKLNKPFLDELGSGLI
ncbi:hypothetical protein P8625_09290 [Tenacibaculum tangerinum]|uniref:Uncharacterized protein n=1 Tax=Tenacibaculum tangerinum TaxID=3038772 RepID=A0ABY8L2T8_9FLAO|nr:hypothetical protein [Tenacibaculum tangerinum]WGH74309.1 hypothetical protein P8625_09290 [Tenacibaculum tangerinum]